MITEWDGTDLAAIRFLEGHGYRVSRGGIWYLPTPHHIPTEMELAAVTYLCNEWDYDYDFSPFATCCVCTYEASCIKQRTCILRNNEGGAGDH